LTSKIAQEIQQSKPFTCLGEEVFLNIARTYGYLEKGLAELLRPYGISPTQYNMLRILRGAGPEGLSCSDAARRMVTHDPDVTRLFDRLAKRGLIERRRSPHDRRLVIIAIAPSGLEILAKLDQPVIELHREQFRVLDDNRMRQLIHCLEELRP
jgi:DNA-binding MarR family transcriptional regulator